jgi:exosome complex component RRP41
MKDLIAACAAGKIDDQIVLDLSDSEDQKGQADLPVAISPRTEKISLLQMDGLMSYEEYERALNLAVEGCKQLHAMQQEALKKKFAVEEEEAKGETENEVSSE